MKHSEHRPDTTTTTASRPRSEAYRRGWAEGYRRGYLEGRARSVTMILEVRGIAMRAADRDFILACPDTDRLDQWLRRALTISDISQLFTR